jgi:integrase
MPFPSGLKFRDRLADRDGVFFFLCQRSDEHPPGRPRTRESFTNRTDRERYVLRHDALYHDELLEHEIRGDAREVPLLGEVILAYLERMDAAVRAGDNDPKTQDFYRKASARLLRHLGADTQVDRIDTEAIMRYDRARRTEKGSTTKGALIKKDVSALGTMMRAYGIAPAWVLGRGAIRAKRRPKAPIGVDTIVWFIQAMKVGSIERDVTTFKIVTGIRNEELYALNVGDVSLTRREVEFRLRNKQGDFEQHVIYLNDDALEIVTRRVRDRSQHSPLFTLNGRRLTYSSLRKRFLAASKRATVARRKEDPYAPEICITAIGQFRHEAATEVLARLGDVRVVQGQLGHTSQLTTERRYILTARDKKVANSKRFAEALDGLLTPPSARKRGMKRG